MYKVFINDRLLNVVHFSEKVELNDGVFIIKYHDETDVDAVIKVLETVPRIEVAYLLCENPETAFEVVKKNSSR